MEFVLIQPRPSMLIIDKLRIVSVTYMCVHIACVLKLRLIASAFNKSALTRT